MRGVAESLAVRLCALIGIVDVESHPKEQTCLVVMLGFPSMG